MPKHTRPWLRFIEGTEGGQAGNGVSDGGSGTGAAGDDSGAGKTGGDHGSGDRGSGDDDNGGQGDNPGDNGKPGDAGDDGGKNPDAKPGQKQSEPTPEPHKAGDKADSEGTDQVAALQAKIAEMEQTVATLSASHAKAAEEKHAQLTEEVAKKAGLPEGMASRLQGETQEQLEADAKKLAQTLGFRVVDPTQGAGAGGGGRARSMTAAIQAKIAEAGLK